MVFWGWNYHRKLLDKTQTCGFVLSFFVSGLFVLNLFTRDLTHELGAKGIFWTAPANEMDQHGSTCNMDKHEICMAVLCMAVLHHKWLVRFLPSTVQDNLGLGYGHLPFHLGIPSPNMSPWGWRSTLKGIHSLRHVLVQSFSLVYLDDGRYLGGCCWYRSMLIYLANYVRSVFCMVWGRYGK